MAYKEPLFAAAENARRWASEEKDPRERADLLRLARDLEAEAAVAPHEPKPKPQPKPAPPPKPKIKIEDPVLAAVTERLEQKLDEVAKAMTAPKKVIRDADGRPVGVEPA